MNVVILHSHFRRGGVTQVVENQLAALSESISGRVVLASGGRNDGLSQQSLRHSEQLIIEGLDYDAVTGASIDGLQDRAEQLVNQIAVALQQRKLFPDQTVLHWHNHSLGKNVAVPLVVRLLATQHGYSQLLQIHDFAEDYRPQNYTQLIKGVRTLFPAESEQRVLTPFLYPRLDSIRYATLTSGDARALSAVGVDRSRVHVLPNCVTLTDDSPADQSAARAKLCRAAGLPTDSRWCVYPVRGIRRKNVGEFLLLSRLLPVGTFAGITLAPETDIESQSYRRWREIAQVVAPQTVFDAGRIEGISFLDNLSAAEFVISTSVAEGFGMAYLEPWLAGRGVIARRLPNVVNDFQAAGVQLDRFYDAVWIPADADWIGESKRQTRNAFDQAWHGVPAAFRPQWRDDLSAVDQSARRIDFAALIPARQIEVLQRMHVDSGFANAIREHNRTLVDWLAAPFATRVIDANADRIQPQYSLARAAEQLITLYRQLPKHKKSDLQSGQSSDFESAPDQVSVAEIICGERNYFPCRTETEIAR
ncbi:hypothetical protein NHH03_05670 [Stieleria sp. TO1_6]|uniref:hypothetical protein n=1 Tax=Stieleria tagensis TaxID=2956795 RepID=UPI00209BABFA|nr:hypothetical protein [Stieleria tagensis]MCO8121218.1 hypothetical protein [Stieleria tagensis]